MIKRLFFALSAVFCLFSVTSCGDDDPISHEPDMPSANKQLTAPHLDKDLTTTDLDGVSFRVRFTNGGDTNDNMSCTVHWARYSGKQSRTPSHSDMTRHESMRQYGGGTKTKTTFDKSHAGISGGTYLYYYFECSNSRQTTRTPVTYTIVKR